MEPGYRHLPGYSQLFYIRKDLLPGDCRKDAGSLGKIKRRPTEVAGLCS